MNGPWGESAHPLVPLDRSAPFLRRDGGRTWLRVLGALGLVFGATVQIFHDSVICPGEFECFDAASSYDRMQWMFTIIWILAVVGFFLAKRGAAIAGVALGALGLLIVTRHTPQLWWTALTVISFSLLAIGSFVAGRLWDVPDWLRPRGEPHRPPWPAGKAARDPVLSAFLVRRLAVAAALLIPAIPFAAIGLPNALEASSFERTAPHADGTVVGLADGGFRVRVRYQHPSAGRREVWVNAPFYEYAVGEPVDVLYDSGDASHIEIDGEVYDGLSVAFVPAVLVLAAMWLALGAVVWVRRVSIVVHTPAAYAMHARRWIRGGLHGGTWITLFAADLSDTTPLASYRLMTTPPPDPRQQPEVVVRAERRAGGVVVARNAETVFWPGSPVRGGTGFHRNVWTSIVPPPPVPPPLPTAAPPTIPGRTAP